MTAARRLALISGDLVPEQARVASGLDEAGDQSGNLIFQCRCRGEAVVDGDVRSGGFGLEPHPGREHPEVRQLG